MVDFGVELEKYGTSYDVRVKGQETDDAAKELLEGIVLKLEYEGNKDAPWLEDMQLLDDGSLLILLTQKRDDGSANELMFFRLTGF